MFSNPLVAAMAMQILFFLGILVIFVFVIRALSSLGEEMREAFRKQQMFLSDLERQFTEMSFTLRRLQGEEGESPPRERDAELPLLSQKDDLLSMLEAAARQAPAQSAGFDDHLLPPSRSRPPSDEYDPVNDPDLFEDPLLSGGYGGRGQGASRLPKRDKR